MIRHIVFLFISLFVISCTNEKKNNNDTSREISLVDTKSCSLENVISKMEIIELLRIEDAYIAGYKSFLAKNNLYIFEDKKRYSACLCFHIRSVSSGYRNSVSCTIPYGVMQETLFLTSSFSEGCNHRATIPSRTFP